MSTDHEQVLDRAITVGATTVCATATTTSSRCNIIGSIRDTRCAVAVALNRHDHESDQRAVFKVKREASKALSLGVSSAAVVGDTKLKGGREGIRRGHDTLGYGSVSECGKSRSQCVVSTTHDRQSSGKITRVQHTTNLTAGGQGQTLLPAERVVK